MAIPAPPLDAAKGIMVVTLTDGVQPHRMRFHLGNAPTAVTNADYAAVVKGTEATAAATFTALCGFLKVFVDTNESFILSALYTVAGSGVATQIFGWTAPAAVVGTSSPTGDPALYAGRYTAVNFRTSGGNRMRFFILNPAAWGYAAPSNVVANAAGNDQQKLVAYLTGAATAICAHDGTAPTAPGRFVFGINKKLRRRTGWA